MKSPPQDRLVVAANEKHAARYFGEMTYMVCRSGSRQPVILVAEQELLLRFLVAEFLRAAGYEVIEVGDVEEVMPVLRADTPVDLVFCDVHFACGKTNLDVLRRLSNHQPRVRVILTSPCSGAAAAQMLAMEYISKPYRTPDLALRIGSLLRDDPKVMDSTAHTAPRVQSLQPA
jgi:two-component system, response regulator PdtaR